MTQMEIRVRLKQLSDERAKIVKKLNTMSSKNRKNGKYSELYSKANDLCFSIDFYERQFELTAN